MNKLTMKQVFEKRGAIKAVADACNISMAAVSKWRFIPKTRAQIVANTLDIDIKRLPFTVKENDNV